LKWADVPKGVISSAGGLTIDVETVDRLIHVSETGSFGGGEWIRVDSAPADE
jgi:hypothetical protein